MKKLLNTIKWDFILMFKYGIVFIAFFIASVYCISLIFSNAEGQEKLVAALIFSDPVMYGFLFSSIIILFEKEAQIHQVLSITPMPIRRYIWSKAIAFSLLAIFCSTAILLAANPDKINLILFVTAVALSSILFVFIGIIGVSFVQNFNQFILLMPIVLAPICLPFLDYFDVYSSWIFYLIPTQASLILFESAVNTFENWQVTYAIIYLLLCNWIAYIWALKSYKKRILNTSRDE
jgi:fluoroquinolone transport system permease protein